MSQLTQARLKELLHYDPETGTFTWRLTRTGQGLKGSIAGSRTREGYNAICIEGKTYKAHRLAFFYMLGEWPIQSDHINHIRHDNRWCNLLSVTNKQNARNRTINSKNTSGHMGVSFNKQTSQWAAYIKVDQKRIHLGLHDDKSDAITARKAAEIKYGFHPNHGGESYGYAR